jgi:hypothetical protein
VRERARERARRAATRRKLGELVGSLSHGEHRQVALAMALPPTRAADARRARPPASRAASDKLLTELLLALDATSR